MALLKSSGKSVEITHSLLMGAFLIGMAVFLFSGMIPLQAQEQKASAVKPSWKRITSLYKQRAFKHVLLELTPVVTASVVDTDYLRRAWFLLGQCYIELEEHELALQSFQTGQKLDDEYPDLWTYHKMRAYLRSNQQAEAIPLIKKLLQPPVNPFYLKKIKANIKNYYQTPESAPLIHPILSDVARQESPLLHDHHIIDIFSRSASILKEPFPPRFYVTQWLYPEDLATAKQSDASIARLKIKKQAQLTARDYLKRIQRLRELKLFDYMIKIIPQQIDDVHDPKIRTRLANIYLRALFQEKQYHTILNLRKESVLTKKYNAYQTSQLFWSMRSFQRLKHLESAKQTVTQLEEVNPASTWLPEAYQKMAETHEVLDDEKSADFWWQKLAGKFPRSKEAEIAFWKLAWYRYRNQHYRDALHYIHQEFEYQNPSPEVSAKFLYWQGKLQYFAGQSDQADQTFKKLRQEWPNTYYNLRFLNQPGEWSSQIRSLGISAPQRKFWHQTPVPPTGKIKKLVKWYEFLFAVGQNEQAVFEILHDVPRYNKRSIIWKGSELLYRHEEFYPLQNFVSNYFLYDLKKLSLREPSSEDQTLWQFAYPRPYWSFIEERSRKAGIDPYWVLATIREESLYDPHALSIADAHGLMQLIHRTAYKMARQQKVNLTNINNLYDPYINIRLGTHYLGNLAREFHDRLVYVSGGYNAGEHRVREWLKKYGELPMDEYVESIPFRETRNYVKRVFRSYHLYKKIYQD